MSAENEIRNIKLFEEEIRNIKQMAFDAAHPVNETYTQYPQQDDPMTLYNKDGVTSVWEIQAQYSGAFFRSSNAPDAVYKADDEDQYYTQDSVTGGLVPTNVAANGGPSISPTPSGTPIVIEGKPYQRYVVTASSRNAADYIIKTNLLSIQTSQNLKHKHNGTTNGMSGNSSGWVNEIMTVCKRGGSAVTPSRSGNMNFSQDTNDWGGGDASQWRLKPTTISNNVSHTHTFDTSEVGNDESRPNNYTQIVWKRIK